jgi:iron complex outermembrane receptor protein
MKRLILATVSLAAIATPALAQDDEVVIQAQRENASAVSSEGDLGALGTKKAEDVPFTVRSYNEALILNQQPLTLGALLENDPTIRTTYGFGNASEQFVIRGFQLFGDDVGLNGLYGIAPRQLVAPELFESVQVLNGASAFLNGAAPGGSGIGGSVNLQLKRAGRDLNRVTASYIGDQHFGGSFDVARRFGDGSFGVRVNGAFRSGDVAVEGEFRRTAVLGAAFDWRGERVRASLDLGYQRVEVDGLRPKVTVGTTVVPRLPEADANYAQPWTYTDMRDVFGVARIEYDVADNAMFYASAGARDGMEEGIYGGITILDATTGAANGNALYVPRTDNNEAIEAGLRVKLGQAVTHEFNLGGNIAWQVNRNAFDFLYGPGFAGFATNLYSPTLAAIPASTLVGGDLDDPFPISRTRLWSVYASDTLGLFDNRLLVTGGLRLQSIRVKAYNAYNGGLLDTTYDESAVTPVVGVVVKPVAGVSLFANRIEGLQQGPTAPIDPLLVNSGAVLAPTKSVQYEVGGKVRIGGFDASLAVFQIDLPTAYAVPTGTGTSQVYGLFGKQSNRGIELSFAGEVAPGLRLIGGGTVVDAKLRETLGGANEGNRAQGVPEYTANLNAEWDMAFVPGLTLTGRVVHTGPQAVNIANTLELDDWTRFDVGARYVFAAGDKPLTLRVGVDNVANARYWASAYDAFNQALLQGAPRTVRASLSVDF